MRHLLVMRLLGCGRGLVGEPPTAPAETGAITSTPPTESEPVETAETADTHETADTVDTHETDVDTVPDPGSIYGDPSLLCHLELTCDAPIVDDPKTDCGLVIVAGDGPLLYDGRAGVELRGRSSLGFPKPQYSVELREAAGPAALPAGATWRFSDDRVAPDPSWNQPGFDDAAWASGPAPLGYGDGQPTALSYGPNGGNKPITAWFRAAFDVVDPAAELVLGLRRDDGAVVYLNGVEIRRDNLPAGPIDASTRALTSMSGSDETAFVESALPPELLVAGSNLLAVEVHQVDPTSSDLTLDAWVGPPIEEADVELFGFGEESDWVLDGMYVDRALVRSKLVYDVFRDLSPANYASESALCELTLNGAWAGVYRLSERVKRGDDRVDIPADAGDGQSFLVKLDDEDGLVANVGGSGTWQLTYPRAEDATPEQSAAIAAYLQAWQAAYNGPDPERVFDYVDLDSAVNLVIAEELARNVDAWFLSLYLYKEPGGKMRWVPWDVDLSFGQPSYANNESPIGFVESRPPFIAAMSGVPAFREALAARWAELRVDTLSDAAILARLDAQLTTLGPVAYDNFTVWPIEDIEFGWGGYNYLYAVSSYDEELARVRAWIPERTAWLDAHIGEW